MVRSLKNIFTLFLLLVLCSVLHASDIQWTKTPRKIRRDPVKLAHYLTDNTTTEEGKVRNIFIWIASNIRYDVKALRSYSSVIYTPKEILKRRKAVCQAYSDLFKALCTEAGIKAVVVDG